MSAGKEDEAAQNRARLAGLHALSVNLMDKALWDEALTALGQTIELSEDMGDAFFLEEARFRKALCYQKLGWRAEMLKEKQMVAADQTFFIGDKTLGIRDLD
jgi:hypothetical protein